MQDISSPGSDERLLFRNLNMIIKIGVVFGLLVWCYYILKPFLMIGVWGFIIAVTVYPIYSWLKIKLGNRPKLSAILITSVVLLILMLPLVLMAKTFYDGIGFIRKLTEAGGYTLSLPSESVKSWPVIGNYAYTLWEKASQNLEAVYHQFEPQIKGVLAWFLNVATSTSIGFLKFAVSIVVAGFFLALSEAGGKFAREILERLAGRRSQNFAETTVKTIRNVSNGILGVAIIQSTLLGLGFLIAGVPGAGLWALISLILGIIQVGPFPVVIVVLIYMFFYASTTTAVLLMIWCLIIGPIDNVLKPIFLGRGSSTPMLVVFLGAIGGFILSGIVGLFFGAVILSLGYNLFMIWLRETPEEL